MEVMLVIKHIDQNPVVIITRLIPNPIIIAKCLLVYMFQDRTVNVIGPTLVLNKDFLSLLHSSFIILLNYAEKT